MSEPVQVEGVWVRGLIAAAVFATAFSAVAETFSVGAVNCGAFHYGDADVPVADYADGWRRLAAENPADVFFYEDVGRGTELPGDVSVPGLDIRAAVRRKPLSVDVVELPRTMEVEGVPRTTPRYRALRLTYRFDGKTLAVYGVHLVAEGHIRGPKPAKGEPSLSQRLRQRQFEALIADAKAFDHAILCGDFNAQKPSEYDVFAAAGFVPGNCSQRFGVRPTLRKIPADNIILSPSLAFEAFDVLKGYRLNTDHFPLVARACRAGERADTPSVADYLKLPRAERKRLFADEAFRKRMLAADYPDGEGLLSRWVRVDRIPNLRDVGGLTNRTGLVLRRGVLYRSAGWNDNAKCPKDSPESEWKPGRTRLTPRGREQAAKLGLMTDLDLRSPRECWGMTESPVGKDVCWTNVSFGHYDEFKTKPVFKQSVRRAFDILSDEARTPLVFHCIGGADRTGCLAFMVQAVCGVGEEDLVKDWELTGCYTARLTFTHEKGIDRFLRMLADYPGDTAESRVRAFLADCGVSDGQVESVRKKLLSNPKEKSK